jgi:hypothetical protein
MLWLYLFDHAFAAGVFLPLLVAVIAKLNAIPKGQMSTKAK